MRESWWTVTEMRSGSCALSTFGVPCDVIVPATVVVIGTADRLLRDRCAKERYGGLGLPIEVTSGSTAAQRTSTLRVSVHTDRLSAALKDFVDSCIVPILVRLYCSADDANFLDSSRTEGKELLDPEVA